MTLQIAVVLAILAGAALLFVTERLRVDVVALLVLAALALTGLVTADQALSGFSNPAVVTVWAVFILSGGLSRTGVANVVGRHVLRLAGEGEQRLIVVIMLTAGVMSAFMNNVGVAALMLPVVMDIARRTRRPPSRLLMPLAYGCLLGGLMTLIGTPPNIIISNALRDYGLRPFGLFDYTPVGAIVMVTGVAFMALVGRHLLPSRDPAREFAPQQIDLEDLYDLRQQLFVIQLPPDSPLAGKSLAESRLGAALNVNVISIIRDEHTQLAPSPHVILQDGDRLLVGGHADWLTELHDQEYLTLEEDRLNVERLVSAEIEVVEVGLSPRSPLIGQTLEQIDFRQRFGANVLAIWRDGLPRRTNLQNILLQAGDVLLVQGTRDQLTVLREDPNFLVSSAEVAEVYRLHERLFVLQVSSESALVGKTLVESRLADAFGLTVLGVVRDDTTHLMPDSEEVLQAGDTLLVEGKPEDLVTLRGLQTLEIAHEAPADLPELESEQVGLVEVVLSPHTTLAGKTLTDLHFREKYGLNVLAIWREGDVYYSDLRNMALRFGDALLLYGPREKLQLLGSEPDFLVLTEEAQEPPRTEKAPIAALVMVAVLIPVIVGWLPIAISAIIGATLMVLLGCLTMEEAYRFIEWKAVFLIAGMLPLGLAMQQTGAASFIAENMVTATSGLGPLVLLGGLFLLTALSAQVMPTAAVAVLMAPIALNTAGDVGISSHSLMMTVAMSASASFLSPVAHPANVLVMGPGGYRFGDYIKVGLPLTLVVLVVVLLVLPVFWPLFV